MTFEKFVNMKRDHYSVERHDRRTCGKDNELKHAKGKLFGYYI